MVTKTCSTCGKNKQVSEFYRAAWGMPGFRPHCKACHKAKRQIHYAKAGGKDVPYAQLLKREYGLTLEDYNALLRKQAHRCSVCRRPESIRSKRTGVPRRLAVDHDHVTGTVRGLLCHRCNILVWAFEDNHTTLHAIEKYIEDFRAAFATGTTPPALSTF